MNYLLSGQESHVTLLPKADATFANIVCDDGPRARQSACVWLVAVETD